MTETANQASFLTQGAFDRLKAELDELSGPGRTEIAKKIEAAREEGDLKENGGYHAAKDGVVEPGMVVTVEMFGDKETFLLGSREITDESMNVFSEKSPIGAAVNGRKVGDTASYTAPNGKQIEVKILETTPYDV